jgi:hypothetical protein
MAYNQNIPQATDALKVSQSDILANFQQLFTFFGVNHQNFGQIDPGKHKFLQMPVQIAAPATAATETALYSATGAISGVPEFVFRRDSNGISIPFTEGVNAAQGWTRLPSGLVMKWNSTTLTAPQAAANVTYTMAMTDPPVLISAFFGIIVPAGDFALPNKDVNAAAYVTALASNGIDYKIWRRDSGATAGTNQGPLTIFGLLLGVE